MRLRELAATRCDLAIVGWTVLLKREGWRVNAKRIYRLYTDEGSTVRTKYRKKTASRSRVLQGLATAPNQRWSMDFLNDRLVDDRWFRVLTIVDQFTRECLLLYADRALSGEKVAAELERVVRERGVPTSITVDNGSEFASRATAGRMVMESAWPSMSFISPLPAPSSPPSARSPSAKPCSKNWAASSRLRNPRGYRTSTCTEVARSYSSEAPRRSCSLLLSVTHVVDVLIPK